VKLLYIGTHACPAESLARLLVLGNELVFLDWPSVTFGQWGTVGHQSIMRGFSFEGSPVAVSVVAPPTARRLYESYVQADSTNPAFVKAFLDGLKSTMTFSPRGANYGEGQTGPTSDGCL
jgi:hypothetical protein